MQDQSLITLGDTIRKWRKARKLTRNELSERCDISQKHLGNIEVGRTNPTYVLLFSIVRELRIPSDCIFYPEASVVETRTRQLVKQFEVCSDETQEIILRVVECLIYNLSKAK